MSPFQSLISYRTTEIDEMSHWNSYHHDDPSLAHVLGMDHRPPGVGRLLLIYAATFTLLGWSGWL